MKRGLLALAIQQPGSVNWVRVLLGVLMALALVLPPVGAAWAAPTAVVVKASTLLVPLQPVPEGVAPNGHGRAEIEFEAAIKERLKLDIDDVEVIGDAADPAFCVGFYEAVLVKNGVEVALPAFPGIVVKCLVAGDPQAATRGSLNFDQKLNQGDSGIDPSGATLLIYEVAPVRDPVTRVVLPGPNGEPFMIDARGPVALQGVLGGVTAPAPEPGGGGEAAPQPQAQEVRLTGVVGSIAGGVWQIGNFSFVVNSSTKLDKNPGLGSTVEVRALPQADGTTLATEIKNLGTAAQPSATDPAAPAAEPGTELPPPLPAVPEGANRIVVTNTVKSIKGDTWAIGSVTVTVDDSTMIEGAPVVGSRVHAWIDMVADGDAHAVFIRVSGKGGKVAPAPDPAPAPTGVEVKFTGTVKEISKSGTVWHVGDFLVNVDANTRYDGNPVVGTKVEVRALAQPDGTAVATRISVK